MAISKVSDLNSLFSDIFEDAVFIAREQNLMTSLVRNFSARGWMDRKLSDYPEIVAETVAEAEDFANPTTFDKTLRATLTPAEVMAQVVLTDRRIETDPQDARRDASSELGNAIATKIDKDILAEFTNITSGLGSAGSALSLNICAAALSQLRNANAPNPIYIVLHPYGWHDVWDELGTPAATQAFLGDKANEALRSFFVSDVLNIAWFISSNISVDASDDAIGAMFNPGALGFDSRKAPLMEPERDASLRAWELNMSAGYADGVIRTAFARKITHDATAPTS
jgi:hypothetical protein